MGRVEDRVAVMTGGGADIGRACCVKLADLEGADGEGIFLRHDVTAEEEWESSLMGAG